MKDNLIGNEKIIKEDIREYDGAVFLYRLTEGYPKKIGRLTIPLYSIYIEMSKNGECSKSSVNEVFADVGKALSFYNSLLENLATPIDLHYILEDKITV